MTKLNVALLKLEGDWVNWIDVAQQTIEAAKHLMKETPQEVDERFELIYAAHHQGEAIACMGGYQRVA